MRLIAIVLLAAAAIAPLRAQERAAHATPDLASFGPWLEEVRREALERGLTKRTVDRAFENLAPVERVLERDRSQAEFTLSLEDYLKRRHGGDTVRVARRMTRRYRTLLRRVSRKYGVDPRILVAVWGLESSFGRFTGVRPTIPVLATLAWDGRRGEFFKNQLFDALTIIDRGHIELANLRGSWAGAIGQVQFMPSSYLEWAVDFDRDGRRDVWKSMPDVFASIANYLKGHAWEPGRWGYAIRIPPEARERVAAVPSRDGGCRAIRDLSHPLPLRQWRALGVRLTSGAPMPDTERQASLLQLEDRTYLVTSNYEALLGYNCAHSYALSVALLADKLPQP